MSGEDSTSSTDNTQNRKRKTLVLSLGGAGGKKLMTHKEVAQKTGVNESFRHLHLDTTAENGIHEDDEVERVRVETHNRAKKAFEEQKDRIGYLTEDMELSEVGANRQRPVSRYKTEAELDRIYNRIEAEIEDLSEKNAEVVVFLLSSLAGGTGSGSLPLVSMVVRDIADNIEEADVRVLGTVSVSKLKKDSFKKVTDPTKHINSHTAVRELHELLKDERHEIHVPASDHETIASPIVVDGSPFDSFFTVLVDEESIDSSGTGDERTDYRENVNYRIAHLINWIQSYEKGLENIFEDDLEAGGVGYTVDLKEVRFPIEDIESLADERENLKQLREKREDLEEKIDELKDERKRLKGFLNGDKEAFSIREGDYGFEDRWRDMVTEVVIDDWRDWDEIEEWKKSLFDFPDMGEHSVETQTVFDHKFYGSVLRRVDEEIDGHEFVERVREFYEREFSEVFDSEVEAGYEELSRYYQENGSGLGTRIRSAVGRTMTNEKKHGLLSSLHREYRDLKESRERAKKHRRKTEQTLEETYEEMGKTTESREEELRGIEEQIESVKEGIESLRNRLGRDESRGIHQVSDKNLWREKSVREIRRVMDDVGSMKDAVERGLADMDELRDSVESIVSGGFRERFEDDFDADSDEMTRVEKLLAVSNHSENVELVEENMSHKGMVDTYIGQEGANNPYRITFLCLFQGVSLKNTSTYSHVIELLEQGRTDEIFGESKKEEIEQRCAYPELIEKPRSSLSVEERLLNGGQKDGSTENGEEEKDKEVVR